MPPCDLEGRHRRSRGTCYLHLLLAVFSSTLEMQVTGSSKMWRLPTWPNHHEKMESETGKKPGFDSSIRDSTKILFGSNVNFHQRRWERFSNQENNRHTLSSNLKHFCTFIKLLYYCTFSVALTFWRRNYFFLILAHPLYKTWITQEPNTLELWNKLHFEEEKNEDYIPCLKYSVPIFVE